MELDDVEVRSDLRWRCVGCGACCSGRYRVELTETDLASLRSLELERELAMRHDDCVETGVDVFGDPAVFLRQRAGRCVFLTSARRCGIHAAFGAQAKPHGCRAFPFLAVLTPRGATLRFRPECSGHPASQAGTSLSWGGGALGTCRRQGARTRRSTTRTFPALRCFMPGCIGMQRARSRQESAATSSYGRGHRDFAGCCGRGVRRGVVATVLTRLDDAAAFPQGIGAGGSPQRRKSSL